EGLPNQSIQSLYQDERGYLWIGTWDGLSRYDGYGFVNYQRDPFNPNSLAANDVKAIAEDTKGNLWIGSQGGLCSHDPQNQHFFQFDPPESVGRSWSVADIARDDSGRMWASKTISPAGIWMRDDTIWQKVSKMRAYCMLWDREQLCLGTGKGLRVMELVEDSLFESAEWRTAFSALAQSRIRCLHRGSEEQIWIGTQTGLYVYEQEQLRRAGDSAFGERNVLCMDDDAQGRLWIGTDTGLYVLDENGKTLAHFTADGSSYSLHDDRITSLLVDRGDNLWVGTYQGGLHKVPLGTKTRFQAYESSYFQSLRLTVFAFAEGANNRLWLGTNQGLYLLDKSSKQIIHHFAQGQSDTMGLSRPVVMSLLELADGRLLIGYGRTIGLDLLDWENRHIRQIVPKGKLGTVRKILPLHEPDQYLVVGTSVRSLDMRQETYQSLSLYDSSLQKSPPSYSWDAWQSPDLTIWIANKRGLIRHDPYSQRHRFPTKNHLSKSAESRSPCCRHDNHRERWTVSESACYMDHVESGPVYWRSR
ncbi:MAG: two-component regulator propeller domain-containing protein, partial [Bacteroidota bacterium]